MKKEIRKRKKSYYKKLFLLSKEVQRKEMKYRYVYLKKLMFCENLSDINVLIDSIEFTKKYILYYLENLNYLDLCIDRGFEKEDKLNDLLYEISGMILLIEDYFRINIEKYEKEITTFKSLYFKTDIKEKDIDITEKIKKLNIGKIAKLQSKQV